MSVVLSACDPVAVELSRIARVDPVQQRLAGPHVADAAALDDRAVDIRAGQRSDRRVHVVVVEGQSRLDEAVGGQRAVRDILVEGLHGAEVRLPVLLEVRRVQHPGQRDQLALVVVDAPRDAGLLEPVEDRRARVEQRVEPLADARVEGVRDEAVRGAGVEERAIREGLARHRAVPVVVDRELAGQGREHRQHLGRERAHDLAVLLGLRIAPVLAAELVDVVGQEPAHVGGRARRRRVERRLAARARVRGVRGGVDGAEQLGVDERVLLAGIRVGAAHHLVGGSAVRVHRDLVAVAASLLLSCLPATPSKLLAARAPARPRHPSRDSRAGCRTSGSRT